MFVLITEISIERVDSKLNSIKFIFNGLTFNLSLFDLQLGDLTLKILEVSLLFSVFGHVSLDSPEYVQNSQGQESHDDDTVDNLVLELAKKATVVDC